MNTHQWYLNGLRSIQPPNTFIGGVSASLSTPALLATKLGILESRITNFSIVGADIHFRITGSYAIPGSAFSFITTPCTYYIDSDYLVTSIGVETFYYTNIVGIADFENCLSVSDGLKATPLLTEILLKNATSVGNNGFAQGGNGTRTLKTCYIPNVTSLGTTSGDNSVFLGNCVGLRIYANPSLATNNGGAPDGDLAYAISQGSVVRYVTNFTAPSPVTTLAAGTIYSTAIQLIFTPPSSTNAIDYYEVYVDGAYNKIITASGQYIIGLTASTSYNITVIAVDIFYNKSVVSNAITQSTNTTWSLYQTGLVSYYKLNANSNDSYGSNNGTDTSVSYVSGKVSNAASYNGTSKTIIGNPTNTKLSIGSISCWIKTSASGSSYRSVFGKTLAYNMFLVDGILMVYNWSAYGTTGNKSTGINLNDNLWHHIVFVFEASTALNYLYIDSVLRLTFSWGVLNQNDNVCIGSSNSTQYFNGLIDEASIHNLKLSQTDIDFIYNSGTGITL